MNFAGNTVWPARPRTGQTVRFCALRELIPSGRLQFGLDCVTNGRGRRRFRRTSDGGLKRFNFLALDLLLCRPIAEAYLVLFGFETQNLEIVFIAGGQNGGYARTAGSFGLRGGVAATFVAVALRATFFNLGNVAEPFNPFSKFDERTEIGGAGDFAFDDFTDFVASEPVGPDIFDLLDAERQPAVLGIDLEHLGFDRVTLLEFLAGMLDPFGPTDVADVNQAFHALFDFYEGAKICQIANAPRDNRSDRVFFGRGTPGISEGLLQPERNTALLGFYFENDHVDFVAGLHHLRRMLGALGPAHFADVHQAFDAGLNLNESSVVSDTHNFPLHPRANRKTFGNCGPGIGQKLFTPERNALLVFVEFQNLNFQVIAGFHDR